MRALLITTVLLATTLSGCINTSTDSTDDVVETEVNLPTWKVSDWWLYTFVTPEFGEDSARLVVSETVAEDEVYMLGISSEREAQRHAVVNHNPFLGRVTMAGLSVFENGEPQPVFKFPWTVGDNWDFTLLGQDWQAQTISVYDGRVRVSAISGESHSLEYTFDTQIGFLESFIWNDAEGIERLRMMLNQAGSDYQGDSWFIRATDLIDERYESSENDIYDTFLDSGHPSGVDFDYLVVYLDVEIAQGGSGTLTIKDHAGASPLVRTWGSAARESGSISTIPSQTDEYSIVLNLRGQDSYLHLKVAGGIESYWVL